MTSNMIFSQPFFKKTLWNNEPAFIGNKAAMDSIAETYIKFKKQLSINNQLELEISLLRLKADSILLEANFYKQDVLRVEGLTNELKTQMKIQDEKHENDILFYKSKAKGKLKTFLSGTALGALIVAVIALI